MHKSGILNSNIRGLIRKTRGYYMYKIRQNTRISSTCNIWTCTVIFHSWDIIKIKLIIHYSFTAFYLTSTQSCSVKTMAVGTIWTCRRYILIIINHFSKYDTKKITTIYITYGILFESITTKRLWNSIDKAFLNNGT